MINGLTKPRRNGFSLVEVVIAIAIFSTGIGGFALLLMLSVQETAASGFQSAAVRQVKSMSEFLQLLPDVAAEHTEPASSPACLVGSGCTPGQMVGAALYHWESQLADNMPGGSGVICRDSTPEDGARGDPSCDGSGIRVVKVFWNEPAGAEDPHSGERRAVAGLPLR